MHLKIKLLKMKNIKNFALLAVIVISISCGNNQKNDTINDIVSYQRIDSLLNSIEYERIDSVWMKSRAKAFKDKKIENEWAETGVIVCDLDSDNKQDYIIITKNHFHPQHDEHYAIIAILGKSSKCYTVETFLVFQQEKFDGATDFELPSLTIVKEGIKNMIYFSESRIVDCVSPKYYNPEKDNFELVNESTSEELETHNTNASNIEPSSNSIDFRDIQMNLVDGSLKKAKIYLGEPDKIEYGFGHNTKGFAVYYNRVKSSDKPKNLVLFIRIRGNQWGDNASIEEIYSVGENEKACFGIHCVTISNGKLKTNAANLNY